ncbi:ykgB [Diplocarpon mali]|nr:ykgB [Diplocarpon mali]
MRSFTASLFQLAWCLSTVTATTLYAASSDGNVTTFTYCPSGNGSSLKITSISTECSVNPAALNLDSANRILYCLDRGKTGDVNGSMNSFSLDADGVLTKIARATVPSAGVWAEFFGETGNRGMAMVSYNKSAAATVKITDDGKLKTLESWYPTIAAPGPVTLRQDVSYLHHVVLDPTGKFLLIGDHNADSRSFTVGGDMIRVYSWDPKTLSPVTELAPLVTGPGVGPRHLVFWRSPQGKDYIFFNGEIDQNIYTYEVTITDSGLTWTKVFDIPALGVDGKKPAGTAPTSGIVLSPDNKFIIVSNRDISFRDSTQLKSGPSDTMSTFSIKESGELELVQLAPSGGYSPRQFSLNKKGDLIAIGHQTNKTVVIMARDTDTGKIVGEPQTLQLSGSVVVVIWDE